MQPPEIKWPCESLLGHRGASSWMLMSACSLRGWPKLLQFFLRGTVNVCMWHGKQSLSCFNNNRETIMVALEKKNSQGISRLFSGDPLESLSVCSKFHEHLFGCLNCFIWSEEIFRQTDISISRTSGTAKTWETYWLYRKCKYTKLSTVTPFLL